MRLRPALAALAVLALASPLLPTASAATDPSVGTDSLVPVANLEYASGSTGGAKNRGTDIEFATIRGTKYALGGTYSNGLQVVDISKPEQPRVAAVYDCGVQQGDVQVFTRAARTYIGFTLDDGLARATTSRCFKEATALGFKPGDGTFIADITEVGTGTFANPRSSAALDRIKTVSFVPFAKGSHNHTIHPSGNYIYNSNSDLITGAGSNSIEIYDIRNFAAPKRLADLDLPPVPTSLGADSHDITFSADGKRAYSAALSQTAVIDTEDPAKPRLLSTIVDPTINVVHQSDPITLTDPVLGKRDFLIIEDEFVGALGTGQCPNGGVHVYDITGPLEAAPVKVGYWNIDEVRQTTATLGTCTAHVFRLDEKSKTLSIAYYDGGVRVVDLSGLVGVALGGKGVGMQEVGFRRFTGPRVSDTWAAKPSGDVEPDGSFYLYGNDQNRGLDVYRFDRTKVSAATNPGVWMDAETAAVRLADRRDVDLTGYRMRCLPAQAAQELSPVEAALQKAHHA